MMSDTEAGEISDVFKRTVEHFVEEIEENKELRKEVTRLVDVIETGSQELSYMEQERDEAQSARDAMAERLEEMSDTVKQQRETIETLESMLGGMGVDVASLRRKMATNRMTN